MESDDEIDIECLSSSDDDDVIFVGMGMTQSREVPPFAASVVRNHAGVGQSPPHCFPTQETLVLKLLMQELVEYKPVVDLIEWYSCIARPMLHWNQRAEVLGRVAELLDNDAAVRAVISSGGFIELPVNCGVPSEWCGSVEWCGRCGTEQNSVSRPAMLLFRALWWVHRALSSLQELPPAGSRS